MNLESRMDASTGGQIFKVAAMRRRPIRLSAVVAAAAILASSCARPPADGASRQADQHARKPPGAPSAPSAVFSERARELGIDFVHENGASGSYRLPEITGSGAAILDYDRDGDWDVFLVQSGSLPARAAGSATDASAAAGGTEARGDGGRLYRNLLIESGSLRFVDVTAEARIEARGYGMGAAAGDYNGDGLVDLYLTNLGPNQLWRNQGDGTFRDVTAESGTGDPRWSVAAVFFDYDGDRRLDLFVGNYVEDPPSQSIRCHSSAGIADYCGPLSFDPAPDRLLRNRGDGSFEDVSASSRIAITHAATLGAVASDFDGDGRQDLYLANDAYANRLWINQGDGTFRDDAVTAGCAFDADGKAQGSMGVDAGDYDGDGSDDLFMTHIVGETNTLYRALGGGLFEDVTARTGLGAPSLPMTGFGTAWLDVDNDGWLDLLVLNGAVTLRDLGTATTPAGPAAIPSAGAAAAASPYAQRNQLFRNLGDGRFAEISTSAGPSFASPGLGRGAAFGDLDNDGDLDVVLNMNGAHAQVLIDQIGQARRWVGLRLLIGARDAYGARAGLRLADGRVLWRRVRADGSYASSNDPRLLFGLGESAEPAALTVVWPDGRREELSRDTVSIGSYTEVVEGAPRSPSRR